MRAWMREQRKKKGFTMREMGEKLDISESYYSLIEKGERQQSLDMALASRLSLIFGVSLEYIAAQERQPV